PTGYGPVLNWVCLQPGFLAPGGQGRGCRGRTAPPNGRVLVFRRGLRARPGTGWRPCADRSGLGRMFLAWVVGHRTSLGTGPGGGILAGVGHALLLALRRRFLLDGPQRGNSWAVAGKSFGQEVSGTIPFAVTL